jgi:hypothetical protein
VVEYAPVSAAATILRRALSGRQPGTNWLGEDSAAKGAVMPLEKLSELFRGKKDSVADGIHESRQPDYTDKMPVVPHKVLHADVPFFSDAECQNQVADATIAILRPLDSDSFVQTDVVPTRKIYQVGQYVTWLLNKEKLWEDCYYRDPETGRIERAWTLHVEFVGSVISKEAIEKDRERLQQLEALYSPSKQELM